MSPRADTQPDIWLIDLTFGELKLSQICYSGEHDIEFSTNSVIPCVQIPPIYIHTVSSVSFVDIPHINDIIYI